MRNRMTNKSFVVSKIETPNFSDRKNLGKYLLVEHKSIGNSSATSIQVGVIYRPSSSESLWINGISFVKTYNPEKFCAKIFDEKYIVNNPCGGHVLTGLEKLETINFYDFKKKLNLEELIKIMAKGKEKILIQRD